MPIRFRKQPIFEAAPNSPLERRIESPLLPFDIRYALRYRDGYVTGSEAISLVEFLPHLALYAASKLSGSDAHKVLPGLFSEFLFGRDRSQALLEVLADHSNRTVKLSKLSQVNVRMGVWTQMFGQMAETVKPEQTPFLYAHSTVSGLEAFANSYGLPFGVVIPPDDQEGWRGIMIDVPDRIVSEVFYLENLPPNSLVIDDTLATGTHRDNLMNSIGLDDTEFTVLIDRSGRFDQEPIDGYTTPG